MQFDQEAYTILTFIYFHFSVISCIRQVEDKPDHFAVKANQATLEHYYK